MDKTQITILIVFIIYLISMVSFGFVFSKRKMSSAEYALGGRKLNPWVTALSAQASDMSGWLLTGLPGLAFASVTGAKEAIFTALGLLLGTFLNWVFVAKRLRVYTEVADNAVTLPSYFKNRFNDKRNILCISSVIIIVIFFTVYAASMFSAGAKLFESIFGMDYRIGLIVGATVIVLYTFIGGFLAVSWTDLFQGLLMFVALIIIPIVVIAQFNGQQNTDLSALWSSISQLFPQPGELNGFGWMMIFSALGWGLGYFGMPHILIRFMGCKDKRTIKPATYIAMIWTTISMGCAILIGTLGSIYLNNTGMDPESVVMSLINILFHPVMAGVLLSAVLAAIMSTADSQLLVAASSFSEVIYKNFIRKKASDKEQLWVARLSILALAIVAVLIALNEDSSIFKLVQYAWGGLGAAFGPLVLFSLYSKKLKLSGAIASVITGAVTTIVFKYGLAQFGGIWAIYELIPGFMLASLALWVVSALDRRPVPEKVLKDFNTFKAKLKE